METIKALLGGTALILVLSFLRGDQKTMRQKVSYGSAFILIAAVIALRALCDADDTMGRILAPMLLLLGLYNFYQCFGFNWPR